MKKGEHFNGWVRWIQNQVEMNREDMDKQTIRKLIEAKIIQIAHEHKLQKKVR